MKESDFNRSIEHSALYAIIGADGAEELKRRVIDLIVEDIRKSLKESYDYIVDPDEIAQDIAEEIVDEVKGEIKDECKTKITEMVFKKLGIALGDEDDG